MPKRLKGITRIDEPDRHGVGWYARVTFNRRTYSKYFSDGRHGGKSRALGKAVDWRDEKEKELGIPRSERVIPRVSTRSRTGVSGVYRAGNHYVVAWSPKTGLTMRKFISITRLGDEKAFQRAVELRRQKEREAYGKTVSARGQGRAVKALPVRRKPVRRKPIRRKPTRSKPASKKAKTRKTQLPRK